MVIAEVTLVLFSAFNILRLVSYLPQIVRVARDRHGASAISFASWGMWVGANASTAAYALVNLGDPWLGAINVVNAACCVVVLALTFVKRRRYRARHEGVRRCLRRTVSRYAPPRRHSFRRTDMRAPAADRG